MSISITHKKVSAKSDGSDATLVQPSDWNNTHDVSGLPTYDLLSVLVNAEAAVTTTANLAAGTFHKCTATSVDYTVTLPAVASSSGVVIGVRIDGSSTKLVTVKGNGAELIDGVNTRVMWANEVAVMKCDGTSWTKIAGRFIPMTARMSGGAQTNLTGSYAVNTYTGFTDTSTDYDIGGLATPSADAFTLRRAGKYRLSGYISMDGGGASFSSTITRWLVIAVISGSGNNTLLVEFDNFPAGSWPSPAWSITTGDLAAGLTVQIGCQIANAINTVDLEKCRYCIEEVPSW